MENPPLPKNLYTILWENNEEDSAQNIKMAKSLFNADHTLMMVNKQSKNLTMFS